MTILFIDEIFFGKFIKSFMHLYLSEIIVILYYFKLFIYFLCKNNVGPVDLQIIKVNLFFRVDNR